MIKHRDSEKATGMSSQMIDGGRRGGRGNRLPRGAAISSCTYLQLTSYVEGMFLFSFPSDTNDCLDNAVYISSELAYVS